MMGINGITDADWNDIKNSDKIIFGEFEDIPIEWVVLTSASGSTEDTNQAFFLSQYAIGTRIRYNIRSDSSYEWQGSDAQNFIRNTFLLNGFTTTELNAMVSTSKADNAQTLYDIPWVVSTIANEKSILFISS